MWSEPIHILFLLISVLVNYLIALVISENDKRKKLWLIFGLIYNFARLALYKYLDTAIVAVNNIFSLDIPLTNLSMPIGISFYTFCAAAYLVDVYRNSIQAERSIIKFGSYMLFFPKFISGPITRYSDMNEDLVLPKTSFNMFDDGLREFIIGLGLKVLIANQLAGIWNAVGTIGYESISTPLAWFGIIGYSLQLYFDFYGYSLMAIGLGRMMGFHLPKNFDYPYISRSMTEFWRRWHMTLGSWFRDYVYIPLGGSRKGMGFTISICSLYGYLREYGMELVEISSFGASSCFY
ncbi:MAG: MBOAT family O-acyltransferase [Lachnospiraceae bacterium]